MKRGEGGTVEIPERHLRLLTTLSDTRSITATAAILGITQPAVSQQLVRLERAWGVLLFERRTRGVHPTAAGQAVAASAERVLAEMGDFRATVDSVLAAAKDSLRVDYVAYGAGALTNQIVRTFRTRHPQCKLTMSNSDLDNRFAGLLSGAIDIQFVFGPVHHPQIETQLLFYDLVEVAVPTFSAWASREVIDVRELMDEPILIDPNNDDQAWQDFWMASHARRGVPPQIGGTYSTVESHLTAVATGEGVSLVSHQTAALYPRQGVRYVPVSGTPPVPHWLAWHTNSPSPYVAAFRAAAKDVVERTGTDAPVAS